MPMTPICRFRSWHALVLALACLPATGSAVAADILFIGNSFTFAFGSAVHYYRSETVTDLNGRRQGGVPALFKSFTDQAGLAYDVYLETEPGINLDWHIDHRLSVIGQRPWDVVVMQGFSTLDSKKPGDPAALIAAVHQLAEFLRQHHADVDIRLMATWPRADQTYTPGGAWYGKPIEAMARDVRAGYDLAAKGVPGVRSVVPVGQAWIRAMDVGLADPNPYDGIEAGKIDLWTYDHYHASTAGYYLEALMLFGNITGRDPRSLGKTECSGFELGLSLPQIATLQQVAFDQLAAEGPIKASARTDAVTVQASPCAPPLAHPGDNARRR